MPSLYLKNYLEFWKTNTYSLIIPNEEKEEWHYLAVKKLSALLRTITSKHDGICYCLDYLHSSKTKRNLKYHGKAYKSKVFSEIVMPSEKDNILEYNQYMKSDKMPYIIYADIEFLMKEIYDCENNSENSSNTKIGEHIPCGYLMTTIWHLIT